ncbi:peptide chain release factor N(5)-glutamine methyltransferase [Flavobacterium salilacus subsp. salilacus]|uniref:peptide chain release factor N(5)-glutamine methyltransferase n=1 Tax=Flavobacterium TaxID=237 RepID=UPI0010750D91|nr:MULTISPECIES: peptide chain release factor N(5)-glutamine methyltransferase [Flavobacterium]KAF2519375.1 peptide chain release factor N(5)-glutamine methyltransferase [Flavobacterium salilacus subsp. salilacus]MBE1614733.1 peptide chain release factor N(5)-glutamine methyltransferase [Flavobacterium sp. SaA2.13]
MKLKAYRANFLEQLTPLFDSMEAERFFTITLENLKGWQRVDLALNPDAELTADEVAKWDVVLHALKKQKPIQYIFGTAHFYGLELKVNESTLIPRPETEELVEWIIKENTDKGKINILDIGTGSGCIAIALAKNLPNATVYAIDVSAEALKVAQENAKANNTNVTFWQKDILTTEELPQQFDVIVSNPPYVRHLEKQEIKSNVLDYEPHLALFVEDNDPLLFYKKIAVLAKKSLTTNGKLYFEINQYLGKETAHMLEEYHYKNVEIRKDLYGNNRMIGAVL